MTTCFLHNLYCCYLPAHCSHDHQPLDKGVFNATKAAYRKELAKLASLTDFAPVDKINFIRAYAKAREIGMTSKTYCLAGELPVIGQSHVSKLYGIQRFKQTRQRFYRNLRLIWAQTTH